jgi:threonine dehydrogenase-like Zn-dependent dehydrogenase
MNVVCLHAQGELLLHTEPEPIPAAGEVLLRVKAAGVCGSDLHRFSVGGIRDVQLEKPLILKKTAEAFAIAQRREGLKVIIEV